MFKGRKVGAAFNRMDLFSNLTISFLMPNQAAKLYLFVSRVFPKKYLQTKKLIVTNAKNPQILHFFNATA
jgi:hypothetical protein